MEQSKSTSLEQVKMAASRFLLLKDTNVIDVVMAVFVANRIPSDPLWMFLTGPPSSAKTEILTSLNGHSGVTLLSSLTPNTFVSGKKVKGWNCSLLPQLTGSLLVFKDFTTLLTQYREARAEIFAQLREIYDGKFSKAFGTGETVSWTGKVGMIAGVTPVIDKYSSVNTMLGERFLHYRVGEEDPFNVACRAYSEVMAEGNHRQEFHDSVKGFLARFDGDLNLKIGEPEAMMDRIGCLAILTAHARSAVYRNRYDRCVEVMPQPEGPARLTKQLKLLALALAVVREQDEIDKGIYEVVKKVARDTIPRLRLKVLEALWSLHVDEEEKKHRTKEIGLEASIPTVTAKLALEDLHLLRLVDRDTENEGDTAAYVWRPSEFLTWLVRTTNAFS